VNPLQLAVIGVCESPKVTEVGETDTDPASTLCTDMKNTQLAITINIICLRTRKFGLNIKPPVLHLGCTETTILFQQSCLRPVGMTVICSLPLHNFLCLKQLRFSVVLRRRAKGGTL
jgi:hypothetical protein